MRSKRIKREEIIKLWKAGEELLIENRSKETEGGNRWIRYCYLTKDNLIWSNNLKYLIITNDTHTTSVIPRKRIRTKLNLPYFDSRLYKLDPNLRTMALL